jgi:hypothetical protein
VPFQMPHDRAPRWFYTAGFHERLAHPEMIVFDVPAETALGAFQTAFDTLSGGGQALQDGMVWAQEGRVRTVLREAHVESLNRTGWLALAQERYRRKTGNLQGFRAFQIVLPDREGRLPWEPGHDEDARRLQPQLYDPPPDQEQAATPVSSS